ncbi:hypothetical protein Arub01_37800 [Actinomadura rubrobrunea]|uniref:Uncharacterized protein n=1 Tax=Actinomadura rubrobrunea TaxID=115335 RepID=A0A9W6UVC6_9ACTN|nr:hypothetical protein Arub01_37800 [Actinomadura rubrobrunea]
MTSERAGRVAQPVARVDARTAAAQIEREFPGVVAWFGRATRTWWAMVPIGSGWRLVEAIDPAELRQAILTRAMWPWPAHAVVATSPATGMSRRTPQGRSG